MKKQKSIYYRRAFERRNLLKERAWAIVEMLCSYPRIVLEVFLRRNMGERHFKMSTFCSVLIIMVLLPFLQNVFGYYRAPVSEILLNHSFYYLFVGAYFYFGLQRGKEVRRNPSVYNFGKYSKYSGDINPFFYQFKGQDGQPNIRLIEINLEPLPFFVAGLLMFLVNPMLGVLLVICSLFYCLSYKAAYYFADMYIMDMIDKYILGEEIRDIFLGDKTPDKARGVEFRGRKPKTRPLKMKLWNEMQSDFTEDSTSDAE